MDIGDFLDICYAYSINSPEMRADIRSAMLGYMFEFEEQDTEAEKTFEGFKKAALSPSMLDELDAFGK